MFLRILKSNIGEGLTNLLVGAGISAAIAGMVMTYMSQQKAMRVGEERNVLINQISYLAGNVLGNSDSCTQTFTGISPTAGTTLSALKSGNGNIIPSLKVNATYGAPPKQVKLNSIKIKSAEAIGSDANRLTMDIVMEFETQDFSAEGVLISAKKEERDFQIYAVLDGGTVKDCLGDFLANSDEVANSIEYLCELLTKNPDHTSVAFLTSATKCYDKLSSDFYDDSGTRHVFPMLMNNLYAEVCSDLGGTLSGDPATSLATCQLAPHGTRCSNGVLTGVDGTNLKCENFNFRRN